MNQNRLLTGYFCVAAAFVGIVLLGLGVIPPIPLGESGAPLSGALLGLVPGVLVAAAVLALGLWLIRGARKP